SWPAGWRASRSRPWTNISRVPPAVLCWKRWARPRRGRGYAPAPPVPRAAAPPRARIYPEARGRPAAPPPRLRAAACAGPWPYPRMTCPGCGEQSSAKLPIFADAERFPHLRADACETCRRYLITVDGRKDADAVPLVDELTALPLDLHAQERGFTKLVPNLM